ncbi:MAG: DMT family transporter [Gammaproteobacteria bacterium]|nr:DMT family transporter [Gammaproteobacteria bacterium]
MTTLSNLPLAELAALAAATMWAFTGLITQPLVHHFGATATNRYRISVAGVMLILLTSLFGLWHSLSWTGLWLLVVSGFIGIFIGDTALMQALKRIGPRRNAILFATNAPIAAGMGYIWLGETLSSSTLLGCGLVIGGVMIAIWWGNRRAPAHGEHSMELISGRLWVGVGLGLLAATGQAAGAIIAKPALLEGADPIAASAIRVGFAAVCMWSMRALPIQWGKAKRPMTWPWALRSFISANLGLVMGMTLLVYALKVGNVGLVTTLSATSPILILPLLWLITGRRPNRYAWLGSMAVAMGCSIIFM